MSNNEKKHLLAIDDLIDDLDDIINWAIKYKNDESIHQDFKPLEGMSIGSIYEKPSTRTRMSFDIAVKQLGGSSIILNPDGIHYGKGEETLKDTAKVLSEYVDIVMLRTSSHKNLEEFGKHLDIPIINGLSDVSHPCQIMSDILTYEESNGSIEGKTVSWIGDGNNNMSNSLIEAAGKFNFQLKIGCPKKYSPNKNILKLAKKEKVKFFYSKKNETIPTGTCLILITPDSERTMCTFLGIAGRISDKDIDLEAIKGSDITFFEGYLWDEGHPKKAFEKAIKNSNKTAMSLSDKFCVDRHKLSFLNLKTKYLP